MRSCKETGQHFTRGVLTVDAVFPLGKYNYFFHHTAFESIVVKIEASSIVHRNKPGRVCYQKSIHVCKASDRCICR